MAETTPIGQVLADLAPRLDEVRSRILIEDGEGRQWTATRIRIFGVRTDDPGIVVTVERSR